MQRSTPSPSALFSDAPEAGTTRPAEVDRAYFLRRAADHRQRADATGHDSGQALHLRFAQAYQDRADAIQMVDQD